MSEKDGKLAAGPQLNIDRGIVNELDKPVNGGVQDKHRDVRLRLGVVDNPTLVRKGEGRLDPINSNKIVNTSNGKIAIKWIEESGGIIRPPEFGGGDDDHSDREMLTLTHPVMWADDSNWMGINYLPPVGSIVVVGFRKNGLPVLLGYLQQHYQVMYPLELGEIGIKGYGQNYAHWKIHDEWEAKAWVGENQMRLEAKNPDNTWKWSPADATINLRLKIKAWKDPKKPGELKEMIEMYADKSKGGVLLYSTTSEVRPEHSLIVSKDFVTRQVTESKVTGEGAFNTSYSMDNPALKSTNSIAPGEVRYKSTKIYLN